MKKLLIDAACQSEHLGLNQGSEGNLSLREGEGFWITPSAMKYQNLSPEDLVWLSLGSEPSVGNRKPSSEWRFHRDIYLHYPETRAIVHSHSLYATVLACAQMEIPAFHYRMALLGGDNIRCASYAIYGSQELSNFVISALNERQACLMANHGMVALGSTIEEAIDRALFVERLAQEYYLFKNLNQEHLLDSMQMQDVIQKFKTYHQGEF